MKKILIVDNHIDPPYGGGEIRVCLEKGADGQILEISSFRGPESALPASPRGYSAVVISGSKTRIDEKAPWIDKEMDFLRALHREKIPTLGICYGEQLMAKVFGGEDFAGAAKTAEYGWVEVRLTSAAKESKVFHSLPERFYSFGFHSDEVYKIPQNFRLTANSAECAVQAFDLLDAPMWGVQFHPERELEEGNRSLDRKIANEPGFRILGRELAEKVFDASVSENIFSNFLKQMRLAGK